MENVKISLRNASLEELLTQVKQMEARKFDVVVPSDKLYAEGGIIGMTDREELFKPSYSMMSQIASKLNIPFDYFKRMKDQTPDLYDVSINEWLGVKESSYLIRSYLDDNGGHAVGRAMLSDRYKVIDNSVILHTMLKTIMDNNLQVSVLGADVDERKMSIRFQFDNNIVDGGNLTKNYRNPRNLQVGDAVSGGFTLTNSETGFGSFQLLPRLNVLICQNGMTRSNAGMKKAHLGAKLDGGLIDYSTATKEKNLELIMSQMSDFVNQIGDIKYLQQWVDELNEKVAEPLNNPTKVIPAISKEIGINESEHEDILNYFMKSGDSTYNGAIQALNFYAHEQDIPEVQYDIERKLEDVLDLIPTIDK